MGKANNSLYQPALAHQLLQKITDITISYLNCRQTQVDTLQFSAVGGALSPQI